MGLGPREDKYDKNVFVWRPFFFPFGITQRGNVYLASLQARARGVMWEKLALYWVLRPSLGNQETWVLALLTSPLQTSAPPSADRLLSQRLHLGITTAALQAPVFPGPVVTVWSKAFSEGHRSHLLLKAPDWICTAAESCGFWLHRSPWFFLKPWTYADWRGTKERGRFCSGFCVCLFQNLRCVYTKPSPS